MSEYPTLPALLESFFRNRLARQRNASRSTMASYRDALRMLILFATERIGRKPCALTVEDLDRDLILAFLDELEKRRKNTIRTRNARLTAIRSFFSITSQQTIPHRSPSRSVFSPFPSRSRTPK